MQVVHELSLETLTASAQEHYATIESLHDARTWMHLDDDGLAAIDRLCDRWRAEIKALLLQRRREIRQGLKAAA